MIRPTTPEDIDALVALTDATKMFREHEIVALRRVFEDYFAGEIDKDHFSLTFDEGGPIGFAYFAPEEMTVAGWELWWIVIQQSKQGGGRGRQLLLTAEEKMRSAGGRIVFIYTSALPQYLPTHRFYLSAGYDKEAVVRDFYDNGDHKVIFRKLLT